MSTAADISSKEILRDFLLKDLFQVLPKTTFERIVSRAIKTRLTQDQKDELYRILNEQKDRVSVSVVKSQIDDLELIDKFNPEQSSETVMMTDLELEKLIASMGALNETIEKEIDEVEAEAQKELDEIKDLVDGMTDLKHGSISFGDSLQALLEEVDQLEDKLKL
ncbi:unnamed protein product [Ambrosiozyma monospora]|uniref:Unnamed protein product n=1 Tax=Ambrosiozyma monospora TaxID=43982 RepID=A0ACB5TDZ3_AMBMO|nr:unnamed protein product [Ambrosiozyma monospora]